MKRRIALHVGLFAMVIAAVSCGPNLNSLPPTPTGPTTLTPLLQPNVDGLWGGPVVLTGIAGGTGAARAAGAHACVGDAFTAVIGESNEHTLALRRTGSDITGRLASAGTGLSCEYTGRISNNTLLLTATACFGPLSFRCPASDPDDETFEVMTLVGSTITVSLDAPVNVTAMRGTAAHTYNVPNGTGNGQGLVANHDILIFTRR